MAVHPSGAAPRGSLEQESASNLLSRLISDATALVRNEMALAKAEFHETTTTLKAGLGAIAVGGAVLLAGVLALIAAVILALAQVVEPWIAALIVGASLAIIGLVMLQAAKKKLEPGNLALDRTQTSLRRDAQVVARKT
ncbi:MAG: phage holin family protein [Steroidobacter sp.]